MTGQVSLSFYKRDVVALARDLVGASLYVDGVGGTIVETEAYRGDDPASHSFGGQRVRNAVMFGPPGRAYVYRSYGLHWCLNVVAGQPGSAVLLRALQPLQGVSIMQERRGSVEHRLLCAGPGRLCQALAITDAMNGAALSDPPFEIRPRRGEATIVAGPRIGITRAMDVAWRFGLEGSPFLSRPFRTTRP